MKLETEGTLDRRSQSDAFSLLKEDQETRARLGKIRTAHGTIDTPCFMPCGTQGTVKALSSETLEACGVQILLSNAYHLYLRPGEEVFEKIGTLHDFMGWNGAILTDSGGFQLLSLAPLRKITDEGLFFQSHIDGSKQFLTPERMIQFQWLIGSDILMVLDECVGYTVGKKEVETAHHRTLHWAERSKAEFQRVQRDARRSDPLIFGIVQGGTDPILRKESCRHLTEIGFDGYAIGGLGVGEPKGLLGEMTALCAASLPLEAPRYLMGVGTPEDILEGIAKGVDLFDCVLPTRHGRNGQAFTAYGTLNLKNASFAKVPQPLEAGCSCPTCRRYSRAYLHHLLKAKEILGTTLMTLHNVCFYLRLMTESRDAIQKGRFKGFQKETLQRLRSKT